MTPEDIHELLNRLGIFPKPYPRTMEGAVKAIERQRWAAIQRQRWAAIQGENEGCAVAAENVYSDEVAALGCDEPSAVAIKIAAAIRARAKP